MKKWIVAALTLALVLVSALATAESVKTGLYVGADVSGSKSASADAAGAVSSTITLAAVTVDEDGVIDACALDVVLCSIGFDQEGKLTISTDTLFASKNELGDAYGMRKASAIGKEWNEQAAALAEFAVGKTAEQVSAIAVDESGKATDVDLVSGCTVGISGLIPAIVSACENAQELGAQKGDRLALTSTTSISSSKDASADANGAGQTYTFAGATTLNGDTITSSIIDAIIANVQFDAAGTITSDLSAEIQSKDVLGDAYGMRKASAIGKEWNEQAAAFSEYVTGKTIDEVLGIPTEGGKATEADLASGCTVSVSDMITVIGKAAQ